MAISLTHFTLLQELKNRGVLPQGGKLLEIGEAEFYGDFDLRALAKDWPQQIKTKLNYAYDKNNGFAAAKCIYTALMDPSRIDSIDFDGPTADKYDLNTTVYKENEYDVVMNHGTAEHIFNIGNVFRLMHAATKVGGLMIHEAPFTGWVEHGFYNLQPTLFWDLAEANKYGIEMFAIENLKGRTAVLVEKREDIIEMKQQNKLGDDLMLYVALRRMSLDAFKTPIQQGVYAGTVSQMVQDAWHSLR
jgi:hypothetical protein